MADDYDNSDEIRNLSDDELRAHVRAELASQNAFDVDDIDITVREGAVTVSGRVGTEEEVRIIDHVLTDVIGLADVTNELVVDELRRAVSPEAEHLADVNSDDPGGTYDVHEAIEGAEPWIPPESPTPEGLSGQDPGSLGLDAER